MSNFQFLAQRLEEQKQRKAYRQLHTKTPGVIDFSSNDSLGLAQRPDLWKKKNQFLELSQNTYYGGATGSRLLSGNLALHEYTESQLQQHYQVPAALLFNHGYTANIGLLSSVAKSQDIILYDQEVHASWHDGCRLSRAMSYGFSHNNCEHLEKRLIKFHKQAHEIFVVVESLYSMSGEKAPLEELCELCQYYNAHFIVDEAHSTGVYGPYGEGLIVELGLTKQVFARIHTFGKALGCFGAVIVGSIQLKQYLINHARSLIYATALPPDVLSTIIIHHDAIKHPHERLDLRNIIDYFITQRQMTDSIIQTDHIKFCLSFSHIQGLIVFDEELLNKLSEHFKIKGLNIRPIKSPTVPQRRQRLRVCLRSSHSQNDIRKFFQILYGYLQKHLPKKR